MDANQRSAIIHHYDTLVNSVQHYNVIPRLVARGVLTDQDVDHLQALKVNQKIMMKLMKIILNSSKRSIFEIFLENLRLGGDEHVAKDIMDTFRKIDEKDERQLHDRLLRSPSGPVQGRPSTDPAGEARPRRNLGAVGRTQSDGGYTRLDSRSYNVPEEDSDLGFIVMAKPKGANNVPLGIQIEQSDEIRGFRVVNITEGSPAANTQLQTFDIIRTIDGVDVCGKDEQTVVNMLFMKKECIALGVVRFGYEIKRSLKKIAMKKQLHERYGIGIIDGPQAPRYASDSAYYINKLTPGGLAEEFGLAVGDTLISVNGKLLKGLRTLGDVTGKLAPELENPEGTVLTVERNEFIQL